MKAVYPIHSIEKFTRSLAENGLYVNRLSDHLRNHECVTKPHRHDFYFLLLMTEGTGKQEIDFKTYEVKAGSVWFMRPAQLHRLVKCTDGEGYILMHSRDYYEVAFNSRSIRDYPFYFCSQNPPFLQLDADKVERIGSYFRELLHEFNAREPDRYQTTSSLLDLMYINLSREYKRSYSSSHLLQVTPYKIRRLEDLIEKNFVRLKSPADYARLMKTTTRQLNRMCRESFGKTTSEMIIERVILEAKRNLLHHDTNIAEVAAALGYYDTGYFARLFRKKTALTPSEFIRKYSTSLELV